MNTNGEQMTVKDILKDVMKVLGDINVPAAKVESIGIPIARCINGINICVEALENNERKEAEKEAGKEEEEPEIELVPAEESADNA